MIATGGDPVGMVASTVYSNTPSPQSALLLPKTGWTTSTTNTLDGLSASSIGRTTIDKPHSPERGLSVVYHADTFWERYVFLVGLNQPFLCRCHPKKLTA